MRPVKVAIAAALRSDNNVSKLVPREQIYAVERATVPTLPAVELVGVSSERVGEGPLARHEVSVEVTVSHQAEDGADELLDAIVRAVRARLSDAEHSERPISLADGGNVLIVLEGTRWSVSAAVKASTIRGASVRVTAEVGE